MGQHTLFFYLAIGTRVLYVCKDFKHFFKVLMTLFLVSDRVISDNIQLFLQ